MVTIQAFFHPKLIHQTPMCYFFIVSTLQKAYNDFVIDKLVTFLAKRVYWLRF